ncbi:DNA gyrase subunit A [Buchnera aphidicola str. Bp (Baizongia pistaciae)]|uniref:DNA gyrase subunit A n=1 Tax=Buchnera aphidicola subsp. Baizongia pistaciae (strain Bp) TaxID=224915 RepID=GYRA_BUCBP|nr:DNA topoisomerase (ATP-hydrolyzing) subunit A [Buchnera aphidicola]Q89AS3.1 RecName: Full=DNA gyrase subunit A [Buchnera aphidicola str. Bp (Baizongia pistaciae)]AAO26902.1 DNA gyrase subunit A [Buchnera aphidicola str. Bp (Baizongia pistaciae)]
MKEVAKEIIKIDIEDELKNSYLDYAMSVIIGRALPDVRDGLKPVHRRILFAMKVLNNDWNKTYKKSARIVGDVIGKYHPHGDTAVYDAIVRMAQPFSLRYVLIDGQGNFGSIDGDSAAAMRYTEIRMSKIAYELLNDLDKNTVSFFSNYDGTEKIPEVLPAKIPNLLINGSSGIAVGMATNIPPHNIKEVINGCLAFIDDQNITLKKLMEHIPGPDFPTAGLINGKRGIEKAYKTGKGKIYIRAKSIIEIQKKTKKKSIIIYELPYQVNKARVIKGIANLVKEKKIEGITTLRDESDKEGMRIVIEIKKETKAEIILNQLYSLTQLEISFGINMVALIHGQPKVMTLKEILNAFINHRRKIIMRRSLFELNKIRKKIHILEGLIISLDNIDLIINLIKKSSTLEEAKNKLKTYHWYSKHAQYTQILKKNAHSLTPYDKKLRPIDTQKFFLTPEQIQAILELRLQKLTHLEHKKLISEYKQLFKTSNNLENILKNNNILTKIMKDELIKIRDNFGDKRRTKINVNYSDINTSDLINKENVVITLSYSGYVKYQLLSSYEAQKRGGKGKLAVKTKEEDFIENLLVANTHDIILCFSSKGILYWMKVYQLPEASRHARGRPIVNLLPLSSNERITAILPISEYKDSINIFMATSKGMVKKTSLYEFKKPRTKGIIAINLKADDELIGVSLTNGNNTIMLFTAQGKAVHFSEILVRKTGRTAIGVQGIKIKKSDKVVSLVVPKKHGNILLITEHGYGKRTEIHEFPIKSRATQGTIAMKITKKNGIVIGTMQVVNQDQIIIITNAGTLVRTRVLEIGILGRNTQGVIIIRTSKKEKVVALQKANALHLNSV